MNTNKVTAAHEQVVRIQNGWAMLILLIAALLADIGLMVFSIKDGVETTGEPHGWLLAIAVIALPIILGCLTSLYAYDHSEEDTEITLRSNVDDVSKSLRDELQERLAKAGVVVDEARLTHLAYAPEIAQAMLRRQQAEAVIAARTKIVQGAVSMVDMALKELAEKSVVHLDDERRAAMVSNLMVVLCGESEVHPVVNTGTLYS